MTQLTDKSFVRKLPDGVISKLEMMLDPEDSWIELAQVIPHDPESLFENHGDRNLRYSTNAIAVIRSREKGKTRLLLRDWGTKNCQLRHLIKALSDAGLYEAANYLLQDILHTRNEVQNSPIDPSSDEINKKTGDKLSTIIEERPVDDSLLHLQYDLLSSITGKFNKDNMIGTGGFGDVFLGHFCNGLKVAIKRLKNNTEEDKKQFDAEIKTLGSLRHEYLVTLLGYSSDGELQCLVYQFMLNGSLEDRLACAANTPPLSVAMRVEIARGTAKGLEYLHTNGITHRDIKSANILLNEDFVPKIGDFATARAAPNGMTTQIIPASAIIGTKPYLAPEAYDFIVLPSLDIFSFGVVLLELITGLQALDKDREESDLKQYILEYCTPCEEDNAEGIEAGDIYDLRDKNVADGWNRNLVENMYKLSQQCLERSKKLRIKITGLLEKLEKIYDM